MTKPDRFVLDELLRHPRLSPHHVAIGEPDISLEFHHLSVTNSCVLLRTPWQAASMSAEGDSAQRLRARPDSQDNPYHRRVPRSLHQIYGVVHLEERLLGLPTDEEPLSPLPSQPLHLASSLIGGHGRVLRVHGQLLLLSRESKELLAQRALAHSMRDRRI